MRDKHNRTPLFYAIYHNNYELVNLLLQQGAETLYSDDLGRSALHYACIVGVSRSIV
jgi:ankyrin repeat protein